MIALICAVAENNCIGIKGKLPWNIPEDLKHFQDITDGQVVIMGDVTYKSIIGYLGKPLPNRKNVVLSFDKNYQAKVPAGVEVYHSIDDALTAHKEDDVFFCGGASIYKQSIELADTLFITHVHQTVDGDTFFPEIDQKIWQEVEREDKDGFSFVVYKRK